MGGRATDSERSWRKPSLSSAGSVASIVGIPLAIVGIGATWFLASLQATILSVTLALIAIAGFALAADRSRYAHDLISSYVKSKAIWDAKVAAYEAALEQATAALGVERTALHSAREVSRHQRNINDRLTQHPDHLGDWFPSKEESLSLAVEELWEAFDMMLQCDISITLYQTQGLRQVGDSSTAVHLDLLVRSREWRDDQPSKRYYTHAPDLQLFLMTPRNERDLHAVYLSHDLSRKPAFVQAGFSAQTKSVACAPIRCGWVDRRGGEAMAPKLFGVLRLEVSEPNSIADHHVDLLKLAAYGFYQVMRDLSNDSVRTLDLRDTMEST